MIGTFINVGTILLGSIIGVSIGSRLSPKLRNTIVAGLGLFTFGYGLTTFIDTANPLVPLGGLLIGALLGEWWKVEEGLEKLGFFLRSKFMPKSDEEGGESHFVEGFVTASLVFVIGPIAILGSIQNGLTGNFEMLAIKAILDGFASIAFASSLGIGVAFSALSILVYQGAITLLAGFFSQYFSTAMMNEMTAVGGLILMAIAISSLLEIKKIRTGSFLPALLITPLITWLLERFFGGL
ncbi:MAG: DUF554 domain-containing protein [Anaerolineaceae bacterium]|nr:DUF554 domain-containing protein [Anaerolineaceae bacterium]